MLTTIFILSGLCIAILLIAKRIEEKKKKPVFILNLISKGEVHARELHHRAVHYYSNGKDKAYLIVKKRLPMYSRSSLNKALAIFEERAKKHLENLRDHRLLKKSDGISEFFKNMSEVEKGNGELHEDVYIAETQEIITPAPRSFEPEAPAEPVIEVRFEVAEPQMASTSEPANDAPIVTEISKPKAKRVRKAPAKRRLKVTSSEPAPQQFI